jgi:class 3 adenylate cyclase
MVAGVRSPVFASFARLVSLTTVPPLAVFLILIRSPSLNYDLSLPVPHFFIVTNVSLVAAGVALLVARAALQMEQWRALLTAVGFMGMAALFAVHALATPGMLHLGADYQGSYSGTIVGLSAYLSLFVPSILFAASFTRLGPRLARRFPRALPGIVGLALALIAAYAGAALTRSDVVARLAIGRPPYSDAMAAASVGLLTFSAWNQTASYARTHFPMQRALAVAFLFLALAQVIMATAALWTLAWWEYHLLMFAAVVLALGALFVELDRRRGLERFLPTEVVERVVAGDLAGLAGERRTVTVMFADLRSSTELAEQMPPANVVALLNEYVGVLARCVFAHQGMLDKFLGDGLMAVFGVGDDRSDGAEAAAQAALEMQARVQALNEQRRRRGSTAIGFGIGLHTGEVVLGAVGIPQRSDYTAIGDTVNTASRLQELTKDFDADIVLSGETAGRLPAGRFATRDLGEVPVRGKAQRVRLLTLETPPGS